MLLDSQGINVRFPAFITTPLNAYGRFLCDLLQPSNETRLVYLIR